MLDLENMPLGNPRNQERVMANLVFRTYPSGHMIYLDNDSKDHRSSRSIMKEDLGEFYDEILRAHSAAITAESSEAAPRTESAGPHTMPHTVGASIERHIRMTEPCSQASNRAKKRSARGEAPSS